MHIFLPVTTIITKIINISCSSFNCRIIMMTKRINETRDNSDQNIQQNPNR